MFFLTYYGKKFFRDKFSNIENQMKVENSQFRLRPSCRLP